MQNWQQIALIIYALISLGIFIKGFYETKIKKNAYGLTPPLSFPPLGIFVWGDAVVFGLFWFLAASTTFLLNDWVLFLLIVSVFWVVRSFGESIYWFNQQFSTIERNPPKKLKGYSIFQNNSIWFAYQIMHQTVMVVSIILTIYLANLWLKQF